ncbi:MAG: penicillin-binding transpeptidase domain-containing protein [Actinomycetota bacterium]|nr:penicillin-binding transpeptidase domain-containing protein [Actinomycetota bacterium]
MTRRTPRYLGLGTTLLLWLTSCSLLGEPGPESTAEAFAAGLAAGDLSDVDFDGQPSRAVQRRWDDIVEGMGDTSYDVVLTGVGEHEDGSTATAAYTYTWDLGKQDWTYETPAQLQWDGDGWLVDFRPAVVAPTLRKGEVLGLSEVGAERGDIVGAGGARLVIDRPVARFGIDKTKVDSNRQAASARALARLLDVDAGDFADRVRAAGDEAFVEAVVLRTGDVTSEVREGYPRVRGAVALLDEMPLAPTREFARPILGTVGPVTAEIVEDSDGKYEVGDEVGLSGLQQRYETELAGSSGWLVSAELDGAAGDETDRNRDLFEARPESGGPLRITLDEDLQLRAEGILANIDPASALVAIRPSDGEILAAASGPGSAGYSTGTLGQYAPGSTFKIASSLALLRAGVSPESSLSCPQTLTVNGKSFKNYDDYPADGLGAIDLRSALANSCNTAFINGRGKATQASLAEAAASLGLGVDHDLGFPAYFGSVPAVAPATEHAASMIGQGKVLASPMSMAAVAASVSAGRTVVPRLVRGETPDAAQPQAPLTAEEADQLQDMMAAVVSDGSASFLSSLPGPVIAKTGTAEFGAEMPLQTHAWMIAAHGDLAVAVFVEVGDSGSQTAGPLIEEFLRAVR